MLVRTGTEGGVLRAVPFVDAGEARGALRADEVAELERALGHGAHGHLQQI